ncbi:pilus assembly PilX family protein [Comamonas guangdongensis]|uniref:PilX N-terminal domain-containing pilus assembly protein n=1 Tax=Comamonas guangdongensis TaxID=510515 RepID=A0ABV3ZPN7_9BURK
MNSISHVPMEQRGFRQRQRGFSLIVVLLILVIVSILGVGGVQLAMMGERGTRNDRDMQVAWQAAEAALMDAEFDIEGLPATSSSKRNSIFASGNTDIAKFLANCGTSAQSVGLCALNAGDAKPAWLTVDFTATGNAAPTAEFGAFTGRPFASGSQGVQPARPPRYVIEPIPDPLTSRTKAQNRYVYRVTAMGFGPSQETQAVVQIIYRN